MPKISVIYFLLINTTHLIMKQIAIFASGSGSNAQAIVEYFQNHNQIRVACILSNRPDAYVLERAKQLNVPAYTFTRQEYQEGATIRQILQNHQIDFIVLAGFLWLIPGYLLEAFPKAMINIHPALLPKFGGKGMFGMHVHNAVVAQGEKESGISIHYVNEHYDEGDIIYQATCPITVSDTPQHVAQKVHQLEYLHFPRIIEQVVLQLPERH